jgi:DNA-binding winged helix-turn-helix (wHTH) protein
LRKQGLKVAIQDQPFRVLVLLLERPDKVVTREELKQQLWPADTFVEFDRSLNTAVAKLREALADSADTPRFVETVPRRGYRFLASVERIGEVVQEQQAPAKPRWRRRTALWIGMLAVALIAAVGFIVRQRLQAPKAAVPDLPLRKFTLAPEDATFPDYPVDTNTRTKGYAGTGGRKVC